MRLGVDPGLLRDGGSNPLAPTYLKKLVYKQLITVLNKMKSPSGYAYLLQFCCNRKTLDVNNVHNGLDYRPICPNKDIGRASRARNVVSPINS